MNWVILVILSMGEPFIVPYREFNFKRECVEYVTSSENASTLAVEVIAIAGFNDPIVDISCITRRDG
tara:strand:+ start:205 stop:405 length:201 start_codon:yes stop_codon:yes gene_type:complete